MVGPDDELDDALDDALDDDLDDDFDDDLDDAVDDAPHDASAAAAAPEPREPRDPLAPLAKGRMRVLYRDDAIIAVAKPAGIHVHPSDFGFEADVLLERVRQATGVRVLPAHRLDRPTSGVVLFGTSPEAVRGLQEALAAPSTRKLYLVLARAVTPERFFCDRPLKRLKPGKSEEPRPARTDFARIAVVAERHSLCVARIATGRRHQIRRHLNHLAHQVIGDTRYGKSRINGWFRDTYGLARLALHAWRVELTHPGTGAPLVVEAPVPEDLAAPLARMPELPADWLDLARQVRFDDALA